ncbi:MAG: TRAFAC clade GTPase domain-containing protein [Brooklawnia sp.]
MAKVKEQHMAVFGESGSGKTVLLSSFYGATQEPSFISESLYKLVPDDTGQGTHLRQNYLRMKNAAQAPAHTRFDKTRYSFMIKPKDVDDAKAARAARAQPFSALRLVWHDYPGEWFEEDPSSHQESQRRIETFTDLLESDIALVLVDGQKLLDNAGEEEKYLKSLLWGLRHALDKLKDDILPDGKPLKRFPRIWVLALSKADLHPGLDVHGFQDLVVEKAAGDITALHETLKGFVQHPEALSLGEDYLLLSSARFEPGLIEVTRRVGIDLILPVATMLPLVRITQWADRFDIPLRVLSGLVDNAESFAAILTGAGAQVATRLLSRVPKVGPMLSAVVIPAFASLVTLSTSKLEELNAQARRERDYLTATVTQFRLDLDRGVAENLLVKNRW